MTPFLARKKKEQRAIAAKSSSPSSSVTTLPGISSRDGTKSSSRVAALTRKLEERAKASEAQEREIRRLRSQVDALLEATPTKTK